MYNFLLVASLVALATATSKSLTGSNGKFIIFQQFSDSSCNIGESTYYAWEIGTCSEFTIGSAAGSKIEVSGSKLALKAWSVAGCTGNSNSQTHFQDLTDIKNDSCHKINTSPKYIRPVTEVLSKPVSGDFYQTVFQYGTSSSCANLKGVTVTKRSTSSNSQTSTCVQSGSKYITTESGSDSVTIHYWTDNQCKQRDTTTSSLTRNAQCHAFGSTYYKFYYMSGKLLTVGFMAVITFIIVVFA